MTMDALPLSFALGQNETATSYASRLARYCGLGSPSALCLDLGFGWQDLIRGDDMLYARLAEVGGVSGPDLGKWAVRTIKGNRFKVAGQLGSQQTLLRSRVRLCPRCVVSDASQDGSLGPYRRNYWQFASFRTCPVHALPILKLPAEQYAVRSYDFPGQVEQHADRIREAARAGGYRPSSELDRYVLERLAGKPQNSFLDGFPMFIATSLCERLGFVLKFGPERKISSATDDELALAGQVGIHALRGGGVGLHNALNSLVSRQARRTARHQSDLGALFEWLRCAELGPEFTPLKDSVREFIFRSYPIRPGDTVLGRPCRDRRIHTISTACRTLGIRRKRMIRYLAARGFVRQGPGEREAWLVKRLTADDVDRINREMSECLNQSQASRLLGVSRDVLVSLRRHGLIAVHADEVDIVNHYKHSELEAFCERAKARVSVACGEQHGMVSILDASNALSRSFAQILSLLLDGTLRKVGSNDGQSGLSALLIDPKELRNALEPGVMRGVTKVQATRMLRVTNATIAHLAEIGMLGMQRERNSRSLRVQATVDRKSIAEFLQEFETLGLLARRLNHAPGPLGSHLRSNGIFPIDAPPGISRWFRKKDLTEKLRKIGFDV